MARNTIDPRKTQDFAVRLAELFAAVRSAGEMEDFLVDMFTPAERKDLWERWCIIDMLLHGNSQREVRDRLGVSISKVTRGSRELQFGTGAFRRLWENLRKKQQKSEKIGL